ncbi:Terminase small subunit [Brevibacillus aydinogluensis]|jgi:phage terminase Nu1 subunit (DNA packaging protein)|uniref:Terminase small subunit n=2 Tax=Brevibacillus aydinogluensis TaxID=927786 RepID=A0AA48RDE2_9BACL|nr:Terminase small subunit [Brevibacillus aydinogluensis]
MKAKTDISDLIVNTDAMATLLGFTRQRINQLAKEGILEKQAAGRFPLMKNVQRYIEYLRTGVKDKGDSDDEAQAKYWEEKALHEKAKRETAEIKLAKLKNQVHDAADVELVLTNMLVTFRSRIMSIPEKVAPKVLGMKNLSEISEVINAEVLEALAELSEYDPGMFSGVGEDEEEDDQSVPQDREVGGSSSEIDDQ